MSEREDMSIYGTVKVGDRGQVVIPAKVRKDFNIKPGDLLLVVAGKNRRGIAMVKAELMRVRVKGLGRFGAGRRRVTHVKSDG